MLIMYQEKHKDTRTPPTLLGHLALRLEHLEHLLKYHSRLLRSLLTVSDYLLIPLHLDTY